MEVPRKINIDAGGRAILNRKKEHQMEKNGKYFEMETRAIEALIRLRARCITGAVASKGLRVFSSVPLLFVPWGLDPYAMESGH